MAVGEVDVPGIEPREKIWLPLEDDLNPVGGRFALLETRFMPASQPSIPDRPPAFVGPDPPWQ